VFGDTQDNGEIMMVSVVVEGWSDCRAVLWCRVGSTGNVALIFVRKGF
jgi:hypothetical protein